MGLSGSLVELGALKANLSSLSSEEAVGFSGGFRGLRGSQRGEKLRSQEQRYGQPVSPLSRPGPTPDYHFSSLVR